MGLASILLCVTMKPRNLPELTPNAHFRGLSFIPWCVPGQKFLTGASYNRGVL